MFKKAQSFFSKLTTCQKNPPYNFVAPNESDELYVLSGANVQDSGTTVYGNEAPNRPDSAIPGSLALAPLLSIKKIFKQFIQIYMKMVKNQVQA